MYACRVEALWDDCHTPLYVKPQRHLCRGLVMLFSNGHKKLVLQQRGAFQVYPARMVAVVIGPLKLHWKFIQQDIECLGDQISLLITQELCHVPGFISWCAQRAVSHNSNVLLPTVFKQLWLSEIGMTFHLYLQVTLIRRLLNWIISKHELSAALLNTYLQSPVLFLINKLLTLAGYFHFIDP